MLVELLRKYLMYTEEDNEITDVYYTNDLCQNCTNETKCPLIKALQFGMVELKTTQALEYCQMFKRRIFS